MAGASPIPRGRQRAIIQTRVSALRAGKLLFWEKVGAGHPLGEEASPGVGGFAFVGLACWPEIDWLKEDLRGLRIHPVARTG